MISSERQRARSIDTDLREDCRSGVPRRDCGGGFGEFYAPSQLIVTDNATATVHNIIASDLFFRLGFVAYLVEAVTDVTLTFLLYVLLRPVHANLAKLAVLFRIMATATFAFGELFYFAPSLILGGDGYLKTFSPEQLNTLALLSLNPYGLVGGLFTVFYGIASICVLNCGRSRDVLKVAKARAGEPARAFATFSAVPNFA